MSHDFPAQPAASRPLPPAPPSPELFCIHSYAGESGPRCGWRGLAGDVKFSLAGEPRCPRCGRATLMQLPPAEST
ncbi:MAG TPA: hypothetical protein VHE13_05630 [Opitutus sp.]|nr:hypothetical protein [Opitutus sp.]